MPKETLNINVQIEADEGGHAAQDEQIWSAHESSVKLSLATIDVALATDSSVNTRSGRPHRLLLSYRREARDEGRGGSVAIARLSVGTRCAVGCHGAASCLLGRAPRHPAGGGIGITPALSMLHELAQAGARRCYFILSPEAPTQ
ncbi:ferredoxin reductase domain-containing protein [Paracoccus mutanolyticus]|uniref:hypothetical protein n=1 Tax=Paracoccus mutanolyticus TaxID=1499308 RepID=UPI0011AE98B0|nr:hypothetical protein [Paracoccus mutanolyticus]